MKLPPLYFDLAVVIECVESDFGIDLINEFGILKVPGEFTRMTCLKGLKILHILIKLMPSLLSDWSLNFKL